MTRTHQLPGLRPEHDLLLRLARPDVTPEEQRDIRQFIMDSDAEISWGEFIDQAARHQVLPVVSRHLTRLRLTHSEAGKPIVPYRWIYYDVYEGSHRRNIALGNEYARVLQALNDTGVSYLIRKGPVLGEHVYHDLALRRISNIDIFMRRSEYPVLRQVATDLGYQIGELSPNGSTIVPFDRRTELYWTSILTNTSLPHARVGDRELVESYLLSCMFSLFQPMLGIREDADDFLARSVPTVLYGVPARMLNPADQILDSLLQIHLRATLLYHIESGKDLLIRNFLDLAHLLLQASPGVLDDVRARVEKFGAADSAHYSLHYTSQLYPDAVPADLIEAFRPADDAYLDEYGGFDGARFSWVRTFPERLFDARRLDEVAGRSQVPGPRSFV